MRPKTADADRVSKASNARQTENSPRVLRQTARKHGWKTMTDHVLIYLDPEEGEKRHELELGCVYRIGTKQDNDIVLSGRDVSRHHAMLRVHDNSFYVTDLKSKNGTSINGKKISESVLEPGDELSLSSAKFFIQEVSSSVAQLSESDDNEDDPSAPGAPSSGDDTQAYRGTADMADMIGLLEGTASAVRRGTLGEPLLWAIDKIGLDGAMILYRDDENQVAMVISCGQMGPLVSDHKVLANLTDACRPESDDAPHLRQDEILGESVLVAAIGAEHVLVLRYTGNPPAVGDLRALLAATEIALRTWAPGIRPERPAWRGADSGSWAPADGEDASLQPPILEDLLSLDLEDARSQFERWIVSRILNDCGGSISQAAEKLGMSRQGLFKKTKRLGLRQ